jgi:murein DD-endopeptidase MepM/ murein hydrolase activator NlpD
VRQGSEEEGWSLLLLPKASGCLPRRYELTGRQVRAFRFATRGAVALAAGLLVLLAFTLPRSFATSSLLDENLVLKARLADADARMDEVRGTLFRLRQVEAQLRSLGEPVGPYGPVALPPTVASGSDAGSVLKRLELGIHREAQGLEELHAVERALPRVWPAQGTVTSAFGWRKNPIGTVPRWRFHSGLDIARKRGAPVVAAGRGRVLASGLDGGFGKAVTVDHGFGITTVYGHCHRLHVSEGDFVEPGDLIATMGNTGRSTGPHLHFELRFDGSSVDPAPYLPVVR